MPALSTRERLIFAALTLFAEKGYGRTSIQDILSAADVHAGSLYHCFPAKQDLLIAVLETYRAGLSPMLLEPTWDGIDDPIERIFALLARYRLGLEQTHCTYGCPIGSLALELHDPDPPVRELLAQNFKGWSDAIRECLMQADRRLPENLDRADLATFVLTTMEGAVMLARTARSLAPFDAAIGQLRQYFDCLANLACSSTTGAPVRATIGGST